MKFSEFWLREWVNLKIDSNLLSEKLTMAGIKVNSLTPVADCFSKVVIGSIIEYKKHFKNSNLWIIQVNIGNNKIIQVISNKKKYRINLKVAVAKIGASIPGYNKIQAIKLHGEISEGILCSFNQLGIVNHCNDFIELPDNAPLGKSLRDYLYLNDNIIDISVPSNRGDYLSLLGIAKSITILNKSTYKQPIFNIIKPVIHNTLPINIKEQNLCPCYLGRIIKNINNTINIPIWMQEKLLRSDINLTNPIIDIANYVMLEIGQPINVFNLNNIHDEIYVRLSNQGELLNLTNNKIRIKENSLVISDKKKIISLAGIINGSYHAINPITNNIFLECAFFNKLFIAKQVNKYNIHNTILSKYYIRGINPNLIKLAMERITYFLVTICGGQPGPIIKIIDKNNLPKPNYILLRQKKIKKIIGFNISKEKINNFLIKLECQITFTKEYWEIYTPNWRYDISTEEDLIEEIIKMYGYNDIPNIELYSTLKTTHTYKKSFPLYRIKLLLTDKDYQEIITYSFVNPKIQQYLCPKQISLNITNPISTEMSSMRLSLWPGLINTLIYNKKRQQQRIRLFESGLCFIPSPTAELKVQQNLMLAGLITGPKFNTNWNYSTCNMVDFYDIKGDIETILEMMGKLNKIKFCKYQHPALHPGQSAAIYLKDEHVGYVGLIHPDLKHKLHLNSNVLIFELLWDKISIYEIPKIKNIPHFPINRRDISVVVSEDISTMDIVNECKKSIKDQLVDITLFDVYRGNDIAHGYKSLTISLFLQSELYTLRDKEINTIVNKCITTLSNKFKAYIR